MYSAVPATLLIDKYPVLINKDCAEYQKQWEINIKEAEVIQKESVEKINRFLAIMDKKIYFQDYLDYQNTERVIETGRIIKMQADWMRDGYTLKEIIHWRRLNVRGKSISNKIEIRVYMKLYQVKMKKQLEEMRENKKVIDTILSYYGE